MYNGFGRQNVTDKQNKQTNKQNNNNSNDNNKQTNKTNPSLWKYD